MHPALEYFDYDDKTGKSACIVDREHCKQFIAGRHGTNLLNHLKRFHDKQYKIVSEKMGQKPKKRSHVDDTASEIPTSSKRAKMDFYVTRTEVNKMATVTLSDKTVIDACVEMVTKNGRPFRALNDSGFRKILDPITKTLNMTINDQNIQKFVDIEADNWIEHIKANVKGNFAFNLCCFFFKLKFWKNTGGLCGVELKLDLSYPNDFDIFNRFQQKRIFSFFRQNSFSKV